MAEDCEQKQLHDSLRQQQQPLIVFDGHPHPLIFVENHRDDELRSVKCSACDKPAICESPHPSSLFLCPTCSDFNLHLLCGPLPCSLKQEIHLETLVLKDSHIPDEMVDDEFYCYSCEELRDPRECVYYCKRCDYSAEIRCVMPEIISALMGKCGDVTLRTIGRWNQSGRVVSKGLSADEIREHKIRVEGLEHPPGMIMISLGDIEQILTETDKKRLNDILDSKKKLLGELSLETQHASFIDAVTKLDSLELSSTLREEWHGSNMQFVKVGDYLVPHKLIGIYNDLHQKYGDISSESSLSPRLKAFFFLYLCRAVERMWAVRVLDATDYDFCNWWMSLRAVRTAGFGIQFAIDAVTRVVHACLELRRIECVDKLESDIASGETNVSSLQAQLMDTEKKLKKYKEDIKSKECSIARECMEEAAEVLYKKIFNAFGKPSESRHRSSDRLGADTHQHSLSLVPQEGPAGNDWRCSICERGFNECDTTIYYKCSDDSSGCSLMVDSHCNRAIKSIVQSNLHDHCLFFLDESFHHQTKCTECKKEITSGSALFKCVDCRKVTVHIRCGLLPDVIELHANGYDLNMNLKDSLVLGDDPEDCWCDICEKQRDPAEPVYQSLYPPYIATIDCIMPQIKLALGGNLGDVRLRAVQDENSSGRVILRPPLISSSEEERDDRIVELENTAEEEAITDLGSEIKVEIEINPPGSVSTQEVSSDRERDRTDNVIATWTQGQILESLTDQERELIGYHTASTSREDRSESREEAENDEYSDTAFRRFKEQLYYGDTKRYRLSSILEELHETEYYEFRDGLILPSEVVQLQARPIYTKISADLFKAGDRFSPRCKGLVVNLLHKALSTMLGTAVLEITEDHVGYWLTTLDWVLKLTGVSFYPCQQHDVKNKLVRICFGMKVRNLEAEFKKKLRELPGEIDDKEAELGALREKLEHYKEIPLKESTTWKQYQNEARISKWKKVGELIPL